MKRIIFIIVACIGFSLVTGCSTTKYNTPAKIVNFEKVADGLYRSGQPVGTNQWQYISSLGIRKVIKLNYDKEGSDDIATNYNITVIKVPMPPSSIVDWWSAPSYTAYHNAIEEIVEARTQGGGVLIHCSHGQDRTGLVVGGVEVELLGETKKKAWKEMLQHGYHRVFIGLDYFWKKDVME